MRRRYVEPLMLEPLSSEEIEEIRKSKLAHEKAVLLRDYDDSSDEDESLDYKKAPKKRVDEIRDDLRDFKIMHSYEINSLKRRFWEEGLSPEEQEKLIALEAEKEEIRDRLFEAKEFLSDNPSYIMEMEGRRAIYQHLSKYRQKKYESFGAVSLEIGAASIYNIMLVAAMKDGGIITSEQATKWKRDQETVSSLRELFPPQTASSFVEMFREDRGLEDAILFDEENKFRFLRQFLRQTNREVVDSSLKYEVSNFAHSLGAATNVSDDQLKSLSQNFAAQLPAVRRPTLRRSRVNPDIESVSDFYAEELLRYRSLVRNSREVEGEGFEVSQSLVFNAEEDLVSQKKQSVSRDKREDKAKDRFAHRGTIEEEVFNLGNYKSVLGKLNTIDLEDASLAVIIRGVFKRGAQETFDKLKVNDQKLSEFLSPEKKQIVVDAVELLFGTEAFRSPSSVVETNMMLDLIIEDPANWNFERALVGKFVPGKKAGELVENGGALSYTMKTMGSAKKTEAHSGGIPCGRKLSQNLDEILQEPSLRVHKYGGPSKVLPGDFTEYKSRKEEVAKSWVEKCAPANASDLENAIQRSSEKWYSR